MHTPYLLFLGDIPEQAAAKTAAGLRQWRPNLCIGQLRLPGARVDVGLPDMSLDQAIGELSYPFYIFHELVIKVLTSIPHSSMQGERLALSVVVVSLIIAVIVQKIEKRWLEPYRSRFSRPLRTTTEKTSEEIVSV